MNQLFYGSHRMRRKRRKVAFYGGLLVLVVALLPPMAELAHSLFSAHMVQHLVLVLVAPPLLVYGAPGVMTTLPAGWLRAVNGVRRTRTLRLIARVLSAPVVVWALHSAVLWIWHLPKPYQAALEHETLHVLEHMSFIVVALLFWALVVGRYSRLSYGARIPLVFTTALQSAALGAILTFAATPLYPAHGTGPASWGLTPLADQQLAGAIMWIPMGAVYLGTMGVLFLRWFAPVAPMEKRG